MSDSTASAGSPLRKIPSVEALLQRDEIARLVAQFGRDSVVNAARESLDELRDEYRTKRGVPKDSDTTIEAAIESLPRRVASRLSSSLTPSLVPSVNATGIIVHTNLGRAPLSQGAIAAISRIASAYCNLEMDLEAGTRGSRHRHASALLGRLFPHHQALVVNNAAAGVLLALNTLAFGKEVIISRGELVEIGGSFRIPAILERSGARLREVGTTNKTRIADYEDAIGGETGLILRVHPSNFKIVGFTEHASTEELVSLGRRHSIPVVEDFGSGNLASLADFGLGEEPWVGETLHGGENSVDLSVFSGDKLLGGPQAGILLGSESLIRRCRENPLARALRVDKLTYAALEATLSAHARDKATEEIPVLTMLACPVADVQERVEICLRGLASSEFLARQEEAKSMVGGGAGADATVASIALVLSHPAMSAERLARRLRLGEPRIVGRVKDDEVWLDFRTVLPEQDVAILTRLASIGGEPQGEI